MTSVTLNIVSKVRSYLLQDKVLQEWKSVRKIERLSRSIYC